MRALIKCCSSIMSWGYWMQLFLVDNLLSLHPSASATGGCLSETTKMSDMPSEMANKIKCICIRWLWCSFFLSLDAPLCSSPVGWQMGNEFVVWNSIYRVIWPILPTHHPSLLSTLQFSLGAGFNIGQNAICIYISFFIRPGPLSPLKTLGIWRKSVAANLKKGDKGSPCFAFYLYICFSLPYYPAFCLYWSTFCTIIIKPFFFFFVFASFSEVTVIVFLTLLHFVSHAPICSIEIRWNE